MTDVRPLRSRGERRPVRGLVPSVRAVKGPAAAARFTARGGDGRRLSSVATAIALLKSFSEEEYEIGVSDLARSLGVAKSTVHRLARTLVSEGLLEQNPETEKYRLGIALFGLGALVRRRMNLSSEARQDLFALRQATGETVQLAILDQAEIMYIYNLESTQAIRVTSDIGVRKPAFCTANGRAILAFQNEEMIAAVIGRGLEPRAPKTDTDPKRLLRILAEVRARGYATEDEESEAGMRAVAAPIRGAGGQVVGSVGVAGPVQRLTKEALTKLAPLVIRTAQAISERLGHQYRTAY
ncbi:MAG TPA: IclR family transcriptional regulator [Hyphomicrobiaceae bacterium]|nr:IclR family transcriptional regulator [Hyphomicrobiaceae bacterium]